MGGRRVEGWRERVGLRVARRQHQAGSHAPPAGGRRGARLTPRGSSSGPRSAMVTASPACQVVPGGGGVARGGARRAIWSALDVPRPTCPARPAWHPAAALPPLSPPCWGPAPHTTPAPSLAHLRAAVVAAGPPLQLGAPRVGLHQHEAVACAEGSGQPRGCAHSHAAATPTARLRPSLWGRAVGEGCEALPSPRPPPPARRRGRTWHAPQLQPGRLVHKAHGAVAEVRVAVEAPVGRPVGDARHPAFVFGPQRRRRAQAAVRAERGAAEGRTRCAPIPHRPDAQCTVKVTAQVWAGACVAERTIVLRVL